MAKRILVIDDDAGIRDLYQDILADAGYDVIALPVLDHHDLGSIRATHPDLIILDYIFGGQENGLELIGRLRADAQLANVPLIVSTAAIRLLTNTHEQLDQLGVASVTKPFDIEDLLGIVAAALHSSN